jgi:hypothetical protein
MPDPKKSWTTPKGFWVALVVGLLAVSPPSKQVIEAALRAAVRPVTPTIPGVEPADLHPPYKAFWQAIQPVSRSDVEHLATFYTGLARAIESDPPAERVLTSTASVRAAHRAGMLFLWRGFVGETPGKYPGLRESMEGALTAAIGDSDVPLTDSLRKSAATCFHQMAAVCQTATR